MGGMGRSAISQGVYQMAAVGVTLAIAIVSGALTGFFMRLPIFEQIDEVNDMFDDETQWVTPVDFGNDRVEVKMERRNEEELVELKNSNNGRKK